MREAVKCWRLPSAVAKSWQLVKARDLLSTQAHPPPAMCVPSPLRRDFFFHKCSLLSHRHRCELRRTNLRLFSFALGRSGGGAASKAKTTDGASAAVEEARRCFLPKMRREASTPEGVYAAEDVAGPQELESMERQIDREAEEFEVGGERRFRVAVVSCGDGGAFERCGGVGGWSA